MNFSTKENIFLNLPSPHVFSRYLLLNFILNYEKVVIKDEILFAFRLKIIFIFKCI